MDMPAVDTEFVKSTVTASTAALAAITGVRAAFVTHTASPGPGDWLDAELVDGSIRILVGPNGGHPLAAATYRMWGEVTTATELVRRPAGTVRITP